MDQTVIILSNVNMSVLVYDYLWLFWSDCAFPTIFVFKMWIKFVSIWIIFKATFLQGYMISSLYPNLTLEEKGRFVLFMDHMTMYLIVNNIYV